VGRRIVSYRREKTGFGVFVVAGTPVDDRDGTRRDFRVVVRSSGGRGRYSVRFDTMVYCFQSLGRQ